MERALKDVYKATADPKIVIALGDCAVNCGLFKGCLLYTSDAADERSSVDLGGRRIIKKKKSKKDGKLLHMNKDQTQHRLANT